MPPCLDGHLHTVLPDVIPTACIQLSTYELSSVLVLWKNLNLLLVASFSRQLPRSIGLVQNLCRMHTTLGCVSYTIVP